MKSDAFSRREITVCKGKSGKLIRMSLLGVFSYLLQAFQWLYVLREEAWGFWNLRHSWIEWGVQMNEGPQFCPVWILCDPVSTFLICVLSLHWIQHESHQALLCSGKRSSPLLDETSHQPGSGYSDWLWWHLHLSPLEVSMRLPKIPCLA